MSDFLLAAETYAGRGWAVFPLYGVDDNHVCTCDDGDRCTSSGKHPRTSRGHKDATTNVSQISSWFTVGGRNLAIATGSVSGIIVVDIDPRHGGDEAWDEFEYEASMRGQSLDPTRTVITGSGGKHLYYAYPPGLTVKSRIGVLPGVDIKADGGYVAAPPSVHASGRTYTWQDTTVPLATLPDLIFAVLSSPSSGTPSGVPLGPTQDLAGILAGTARVTAGSRDNTFFALASSLRGQDVPLQDAIHRLGHIWEEQTDQPPNDVYPAEKVAEKVVRAYESYAPNAEQEGAVAPELRDWAATVRTGIEQQQSSNPWEGYDGAQLSDHANAHRLAVRFKDRLRYFPFAEKRGGEWYRAGKFAGEVDDLSPGLWRPHADADVYVAQNNLEPMIRREAEHAPEGDDRDALVTLARAAGMHSSINSAAKLMANTPELARYVAPSDYFDKEDTLLGVKNGVVDLLTGEFRTLVPDDRISRTAEFAYDPNARACPHWISTHEMFIPDLDIREYVRLMLGQALLGGSKESKIVICTGSGRNGKSTLIETVMHVLGDYANPVPKSVFVNRSDEEIPHDLHAVDGLRLVTNDKELKATDLLNDDILKKLSMFEPMQTRKLYQNLGVMHPRATLWLTTNNLPRLAETGVAMEDRIVTIPFGVTVEKMVDDPSFKRKLEAEGSAILTWLIEACRDYLTLRAQGPIEVPESCQHEATEYFDTEERFRVFERDCLGRPLDGEQDQWTPEPVLYRCYQLWASVNGEEPLTTNMFSRKMKRLRYDKSRHRLPNQEIRTMNFRCVITRYPDLADLEEAHHQL